MSQKEEALKFYKQLKLSNCSNGIFFAMTSLFYKRI